MRDLTQNTRASFVPRNLEVDEQHNDGFRGWIALRKDEDDQVEGVRRI